MNVIVVDDERKPLQSLTQAVETALPDADVKSFLKSREALEYARMSQVELAFLDIEMGGMNGLQLAKNLKDVHGKINIIFTTGHAKYAADAYAVHASGYLLKPVTEEDIIEAMNYLYHPIVQDSNKRVRVQTFGNFEVFADENPLNFSRTKTKELLAYLVMRNGARCSNNEIAAVIWEDMLDSKSLQSQYRHLVYDLKRTLKFVNAENILVRQRGYIAIVPEKISCDMYDFINADSGAVNSYRGEFMAQYSWAEFTNAYLEKSLA